MAPFNVLIERIDLSPRADNLSQLLHIPDSLLSQMGMIPPPPGIIPNFTNPKSIGYILIIFASIGMIITATCTAIRMWAKLLTRPLKWTGSDITFIPAILAAFALFTIIIFNVTGEGTFGIHDWNIFLFENLAPRSMIPIALNTLFIPVCLGLIKITIFLTYIELFFIINWVRRSCYVGVVLTSIFYSITTICTIIWSFPHRHETFASHYINASLNTIRSQQLSVPTAAIGLAIDLYLFIIPLAAISTLKNMNTKKKYAIATMFATGFLAIVASILSIVYRHILNSSDDHQWNIVPMTAVTIIETYIGIIIACTPHIAKLVRTYEGGISKVGSAIALCCKCSRKRPGKGNERTAEPPSTSSSTPEICKKPRKLYPGLDISTQGETIGGTICEKKSGAQINNMNEEIDNAGPINRHQECTHPAAQHQTDTHWAERQKDIQERFCDG